MASRLGIRTASLLVTTAVVVLAACSSGTSIPRTYCDAAKTTASSCKDPTPCDTTLSSRCASLDKLVSPSLLLGAQNCMESGVCGVANCFANAPKSATPGSAHAQLASDYCSSCAPNVKNCVDLFYDKSSRLPGALVLPYADAVVLAVAEVCTNTATPCRSTFTACATETIAQKLGESAGPELAECVQTGFVQSSNTGPGGKPLVSSCNADNCDGCCRDDVCEAGTTELACGENASGCATCTGAQRCTSGTCKEPCGPDNCAGCCEGDGCRLGTSKESCGGEGAACASCATLGATFVCSNKKCIDGSCKATCSTGCCNANGCQPGLAKEACGTGGEACVDCGTGRTCSRSKECTIDGNALADVYVSFAVLPEKDGNGAAWDPPNGLPDAYLILSSGSGASSRSGQTAVLTNTTLPFWAETPLRSVKTSDLLGNLAFEVFDEDDVVDTRVGGCKIPVTPAMFDGSLQTIVCPAMGTSLETKLYYRIRPQP